MEVIDLRLRYRLHRPLVLRGISLEAPAGSKVAVCGRTGSGKSSLFGAIARLYAPCGGAIRVDGADLLALPLREARGGPRRMGPRRAPRHRRAAHAPLRGILTQAPSCASCLRRRR